MFLLQVSTNNLYHDWSTYPSLTYPPQKQEFNKALLRETNG